MKIRIESGGKSIQTAPQELLNELGSPILKAKAEALTSNLRKKHNGLVIGIGKVAS